MGEDDGMMERQIARWKGLLNDGQDKCKMDRMIL